MAITKISGFSYKRGASAFKNNYYRSAMRSTSNVSYVVYRFKAKEFTIWATKGMRNGKFKVYVDGSFSRLVNTNSKRARHRVMVYKKNFRNIRYRTIKIVNVGRGSKKRVDFDGLGVRLPQAPHF